MPGAYEPPRTYAEWSVLLDSFMDGGDDAAVLDAMRRGTLEWQGVVADRFVSRLLEAVNTRLNRVVDVLGRDLSRAGGDERAVVRALLSARAELRMLASAASLPALPEDVRCRCRQLVVAQADAMQRSLEDSASRRGGPSRVAVGDISGRLASVIRNNAVNDLGAR